MTLTMSIINGMLCALFIDWKSGNSFSEYHRQVGENATLVSIDKAGHLPNVERPFVYNRQLKRILASLVEENGGQHS